MGGRHKGERKMKAEILVTLVIKQKKKKKKKLPNEWGREKLFNRMVILK